MYYVPHTEEDKQKMLASLGCKDIDNLFEDVDPKLLNPKIDMDAGSDMIAIQAHMSHLAKQNTAHQMDCFLGAGAYDHFIPPVISALVSRGEFLTSYTPYQPEMSQGLLQAIFEYQTMICELTGADVSNASLYDGSTAIWEAILMASRLNKRTHVLLLDPLHPRYRQVLETHMKGTNFSHERLGCGQSQWNVEQIIDQISDTATALVVQYPTFLGEVSDFSALSEACHAKGVMLIAVVNPMALALFRSPIEQGADIVVGEGQPLGVPLSYGGPYFGFMATHQKYVRQLPGRICGESVDVEGRTAYVLTLQAREQHIRREKATSNICTNQALLALRGSIYMSYMGHQGMREVAQACQKRLYFLKQALQQVEGVAVVEQGTHFCEMAISLPGKAHDFIQLALKHQILLGYDLGRYDSSLSHQVLVAVTEKTSLEQIHRLVQFLQTSVSSMTCEVGS